MSNYRWATFLFKTCMTFCKGISEKHGSLTPHNRKRDP